MAKHGKTSRTGKRKAPAPGRTPKPIQPVPEPVPVLEQAVANPGAVPFQAILALQQVAGNRGVSQLIQANTTTLSITPTSTPTIQRATGLAVSSEVSGFAQFAYNYWKANPNKERKEFAQDMIKELNKKLLHPVTTVIRTSGDLGAFGYSTAVFRIAVNTKAFTKRSITSKKIKDLTQDELGEAVDTLYHEARHAEQVLRIAQMLAGKGKTADEISKQLTIPPAAAKKAFDNSLDPSESGNATLIAEAEAWEAFTGGKYAKYQKEVGKLRDEITALTEALKASNTSNVIANIGPKVTTIETHLGDFFKKEKDKIDALTDKKSFDTTVSEKIAAIQQAFKDFNDEYKVQKGDARKIVILNITFERSLQIA